MAPEESIRKRCVRKRAAVLALAVLSSACTKVASGPEGAHGNPWTRHGRFVFAEAGDVKSLNPMLATSAPTLDLSMFLFSYAVRYDSHAKPHPDALSWVWKNAVSAMGAVVAMETCVTIP